MRRVLTIVLIVLLVCSFSSAFTAGDDQAMNVVWAHKVAARQKTLPSKIKIVVGSKLLGMGAGANPNNRTAFGMFYTGGDGLYDYAMLASNEETVSFDFDPVTKQVYIVANKPGKTTLQAVVLNQDGMPTKIKSNKLKITVKRAIKVSSVKLARKNLSLRTSDGAYDLNNVGIIVKPAVADDIGPNGRIPMTWTVKNPSIATVSSNFVNGIKHGKTTLIGTGSGKTVKLSLAVINDGPPNPAPAATPVPD